MIRDSMQGKSTLQNLIIRDMQLPLLLQDVSQTRLIDYSKTQLPYIYIYIYITLSKIIAVYLLEE